MPRRAGACAVLVAILALAGCYDPNPIEQVEVSPDGRWAAMRTEQGELGVLDLQQEGPLLVYSTHAQRGMAWSPNSERLAYLEQVTDQPLALNLLDPLTGRTERPLLQDVAWKADPVWLSNQTLAFLSDREDDSINIWTVETRTGQLIKLHDEGRDIVRLWGDPDGGELIFLTIGAQGGVLWHWTLEAALAATPPRRLTQPNWDAENSHVAFEQGGRGVAFSVYGPDGPLLLGGTPGGGALEGLTLPQAPESLAIQPEGWTIASLGRELLMWNPQRGASPWHGATRVSHWGQIELGQLGAWQKRGAVLTVNRNILLAAEDVRALDDGRLNARTVDDLIALAHAHVLEGRPRLAKDVLESLAADRATTRTQFLLAAARGWYDRSQGDEQGARDSYRRALAMDPELQGRGIVAQELIALDAFEHADREALRQDLAEYYPQLVAPQAAHVPARQEFAWWLRELESAPREEHEGWREAGRLVRAGQPQQAAGMIFTLCSGDTPTTASMRGLKLLLGGAFEPLGQLNGSDQAQISALLAQRPMQRVLWLTSLRPHPDGPDPGDLRGLLLEQWASEGDLSSARALAREDLAQPGESVIGYIDMLQQYLINEEADRWIQRVVTEVLLDRDICERLGALFPDPEDQLTLLLVRIKSSLVQGESRETAALIQTARTWTARLDPAAPVTSETLAMDAEARATLAHAANPVDEGDASEMLADPDAEEISQGWSATADPGPAQQLFLLELYSSKLAERNGQWNAALEGYQRCLDQLELQPVSGDATVFEIIKAMELIRLGRDDAEALQSYLRVQRGMGDPLINPAHEQATLVTAINNFATLRRFSHEGWLQPFMISSEGLCRSMLNHTAHALMLLEQARLLKPSPGLLQRILLEQAALRDTLGQHALAARLYGRMLELDLPMAARASVMLALLQAEQAAGMAADPAARVRELSMAQRLSPLWSEWLRLQLGLLHADEFRAID